MLLPPDYFVKPLKEVPERPSFAVRKSGVTLSFPNGIGMHQVAADSTIPLPYSQFHEHW